MKYVGGRFESLRDRKGSKLLKIVEWLVGGRFLGLLDLVLQLKMDCKELRVSFLWRPTKGSKISTSAKGKIE